jgi:hypothetical protein
VAVVSELVITVDDEETAAHTVVPALYDLLRPCTATRRPWSAGTRSCGPRSLPARPGFTPFTAGFDWLPDEGERSGT